MQARPVLLRSLIALGLLSGGAAAWAQSSPYFAGASIAFSRDSNIFRLSDAVATSRVASGAIDSKSDSITTATLFGGIDQPFGRQRVSGNVSLRDNRFANNNSQNNFSYGARARLDWSTIERLSGTISLNSDQARVADQNVADPLLVERILSRSTELGATVRLGVVTRLTAEASVNHYRQDYNASSGAYDRFDYRNTTVGLGLRYAMGGELTLGAGVKSGSGRYTALDSKFDRRDFDLYAEWRVTGASSVSARLGMGKQTYQRSTIGDFSGANGTLAWNWSSGGPLRVATRLARDTGQNLASVVQQTTGNVVGEAESNRLTTALSLNAEYALTGKTSLSAAIVSARRSLADIAPNSVTAPFTPVRGRDTVDSISFGARWVPLRSVSLACDVSHRRRSVSEAGLTVTGFALTAPYSADTFGCSAQVTLQ